MKYDINKKDYENKKAIGYYAFMVSNAVQNYIDIKEVIPGYNNIIVYQAIENWFGELSKSPIRIAKINEFNNIKVYDFYKKQHTISFNKILRYGF